MSENNVLYGDSAQVKVSFAYGTLTQAASDTYPGGIAFGYDTETNAGAIFRMGKLVTSRILDIVLSNTQTDNVKLITVKYVDTDGLVRQHTFNAVDESLISSLKSRISTLEVNTSTGSHDYQAGDYVDINAEYKISVKYADIYAKIKTDLTADGYGQTTEHTVVENGNYIKVDTSLNKSTVSVDYDSMYTKIKTDLTTDEFAKTNDIPSLDEYMKTEDVKEYVGVGYVDVSSGSGDNEGKEVIGIKYNEMYAQIKNDLASAGIGDQTSINEQQSERILSIENSYTESASLENKNEDKNTISIKIKKRTSESEDFSDSSISFDIPTDKYYEDIDSSINSVEQRVSILETNSSTLTSKFEWLDVSTLLAQNS